MTIWDGAVVAVTGGAGSFGQAFAARMLQEPIHSLRVVSRDEDKHRLMGLRFPDPRMRFLIGDVRDRERMRWAFDGVDVVVHAAALKQVPSGERDPLEFVATNITGTANVIQAAIDVGVQRVLLLSSDKAAGATTLYGSTKFTAEKMMLAANHTYGQRVRFAVTRYGNIVGSRGSVVPVFREQAKTGTLSITDPRMTRFWFRIDDAVQFVKERIEEMEGGELFVPKLPSVTITAVAEAIAPRCPITVVGIRPGEKLHESMFVLDESRTAQDRGTYYCLNGRPHREPEFSYSSDRNERFLGVDEIRATLSSA